MKTEAGLAGWIRSGGALALTVSMLVAPEARADWTERIEVHGFYSSTARLNVPQLDFSDASQLSALQQQLNLEVTADLYSERDWSVDAVAILRPTYDLVYDLYPTLYGKRAQSGAFGTQLAVGFTRNPRGFRDGRSLPGAGDGINGSFRYLNQDIGALFGGGNAPGIVIDDVVFFGQTVAPVAPRGSNQVQLGGVPTLGGLFNGAAALQTSLQGSVALNVALGVSALKLRAAN